MLWNLPIFSDIFCVRKDNMNYYNQKCSHCNKIFTKDDDIVVCPVCGTPQHRECYDEHNRCINHDKHTEGYEWAPDQHSNSNQQAQADDSNVICSNCGTENSSDSFFCKHCSLPLNASTNSDNNGFNQGSGQNKMPFGATPFMTSPFEGFNDNDEIAENVKLKDAKAYVKTNNMFYSFIFKRIHDFDRSRFNFAAFFFSGGWFLYRKQYLIGTILTVLMGICLFGYAVTYTSMTQFIISNNITNEIDLYNHLVTLPFDQMLFYASSSLFKIAQYIIMIISGLIGNRCYYNHVVKKVQAAKAEFKTELEVKTSLDTKGGVDKVLGYILMAGYIILLMLPTALLYFK